MHVFSRAIPIQLEDGKVIHTPVYRQMDDKKNYKYYIKKTRKVPMKPTYYYNDVGYIELVTKEKDSKYFFYMLKLNAEIRHKLEKEQKDEQRKNFRVVE